jgi:hypothetical protein
LAVGMDDCSDAVAEVRSGEDAADATLRMHRRTRDPTASMTPDVSG